MKYSICILSNENPLDHKQWVVAIEKSNDILNYDVISLVSNDWLDTLKKKEYDLFLLKPPGKYGLFKQLYDERIILIDKYFSTLIYPSLTEVLIYENKRFLRDWLQINQLPHPETHVFFNKTDAISHLKIRKDFPLIGKTNIGGSGNGVVKLDNYEEAYKYISKAFSEGLCPKIGPKLNKGSFIRKLEKVLHNKAFLRQRMKDYKFSLLDIQFHFVILQEFIHHEYEWRCVRIGESYSAHKKIVKGYMASGTLIKEYDRVPTKLLDFIKNVTENHNLTSVAIDVFEVKGGYLINEIQCFFGQSDPYQMLVDGKPGRYLFKNNDWIFEEGFFNTNQSYDLRLKHALELLKKDG